MSLENEFYLAALFDDPSRLFRVFDYVIRANERIQHLVNDAYAGEKGIIDRSGEKRELMWRNIGIRPVELADLIMDQVRP
jgi:hypothetical protein